MFYVFEKNGFPDQITLAEEEFDSDKIAIAYAIEIGADYVWCIPTRYNPRSVWTAP